MNRKRRSDRNHIIYRIDNTVTGEFYIGITVLVGNAYQKSVKSRLKKHITRAYNETHEWTICKNIREHGPKAFAVSVYEVVRGKAFAHSREVELIKTLRPQLNTASV